MFDDDGIVTVELKKKRERFPKNVNSFFNATLILLKSAIYNDFLNTKYTNDIDEDEYTLIFAIMFNYRHFIELAIKSSIGKLGIKPDNIHFIDILFEKLEKLWIERTANIDKDFWININFDYGIDLTEQFTKLKNKIEKISKIDKNSTCFRYPQFDRKEIKICLNEVEKDLLCFQDFFENLSWAIFKLEEFNQ